MSFAFVISCFKPGSSDRLWLKQMQAGYELTGCAFLVGLSEEMIAEEVVQMAEEVESAMRFETAADAGLAEVVLDNWFDNVETQLIRTDDPSIKWTGCFFPDFSKKRK